MKSTLKFLAVSSLFVLLAACGTTLTGGGAQENAAAQQAILGEIDAAFAASAAEDNVDLSSVSLGLTTQSVDPFIVIRRTNMHRSHKLLTLTVDMTATPPTATAEVQLNITGTAELWQVLPDQPRAHNKVGEKPIDMVGTATITAEKGDDGWHITSVDHTALSQGDFAADITSWSYSPDPLVPGSDANLATIALDEPDTSDEFLLVLRGRRFHPRSIPNDNGTDPDPTANDDEYNGYIRVGADADEGRHLGFITALNYTRTTDLTSDGNGGYLYPYTDTFLPVVVLVGASQ